MIKVSWFQCITGIGIISFLLFFVNLLSGVAYQVMVSNAHIQEKLGVYFYLDDSSEQKDDIYAKAIEMMEELESSWMEVSFYSKDDAFSLLKQRLPEVIGSLEKYNIENPLPPTIYVLFDNKEEYEAMKTIVLNYEDNIINLSDVTRGLSFGEQEQRVEKVINLMNVFQYLSYFLILVTVIIVISFLGYAIRLNFFRFQKQIEVEKLLWAPYVKIIAPFLLYATLILVIAFILAAGYLRRLVWYVHMYVLDVFSVNMYDHLPSIQILWTFFGVQVLVVILLNICFASVSLWNLLRKV